MVKIHLMTETLICGTTSRSLGTWCGLDWPWSAGEGAATDSSGSQWCGEAGSTHDGPWYGAAEPDTGMHVTLGWLSVYLSTRNSDTMIPLGTPHWGDHGIIVSSFLLLYSHFTTFMTLPPKSQLIPSCILHSYQHIFLKLVWLPSSTILITCSFFKEILYCYFSTCPNSALCFTHLKLHHIISHSYPYHISPHLHSYGPALLVCILSSSSP